MIILVLFYTFKTKEGHEVSLTSAHNIPVFIPETNQIKVFRASKVTLKHQLIMFNKKIQIENILINARQGFYAPLTLTGYLFVNNISTSVFSDKYLFKFIFKNLNLSLFLFSHRVSSHSLQRIFTPIRIYYLLMRWIFGKTYDPFETKIKEGLHPLPAFLKQNESLIRFIHLTPMHTLRILAIIFIYEIFNKK
jgi:hypothetical protein